MVCVVEFGHVVTDGRWHLSCATRRHGLSHEGNKVVGMTTDLSTCQQGLSENTTSWLSSAIMDVLVERPSVRRLRTALWLLLALVCTVYAAFSFQMGADELLHQTGMGAGGRVRAMPIPFIVHAFAGGLALILVPVQVLPSMRRKAPSIHRALGRMYVVSTWLASSSGVWNAAFFDVTLAAKVVFVSIALAWFGTTTLGLLRARERLLKAHGEWMVRSAALTMFIVTFSIWVPGMEATPLPHGVGYPLAVFLSGFLNLAAAEFWIRWRRRRPGA